MKRAAYAGIALALGIAGVAAYVRAEDAPHGYSGKGQLVLRTQIGGTGDTLTVGGDIAMEERGERLRLDILSLAIPGTSATLSAVVATQLFPPGGFSLVYDRGAGTYTIWSNAKRRYYTSGTSTIAGSTPSPAPAGGVGSAVLAGGDLFHAFSFAKSLKDDSAFTVGLGLTGHSTVNGHPATGLNYQYARTTKGGDALDIHGTLQFADDLDGVPVEITAAGKSKSIPESAFRLDFTSLQHAAPADADFAPPPGYDRATSLGDVIGKTLPGT